MEWHPVGGVSLARGGCGRIQAHDYYWFLLIFIIFVAFSLFHPHDCSSSSSTMKIIMLMNMVIVLL
jgi:hypothetical protein